MNNKPITQISLAKRIGVVIILSFVLDITFRLLGYISILAMPWFGEHENHKYELLRYNEILPYIEMGMDYLPLILLVIILMRWKKSMNSGNILWFNRVRPTIFMLFLIFIIPFLIIHLTIPVYAPRIVKYLHSVRLFILTGRMTLYPHGFTNVFQCMVWLWWCDSQPKRLRSIFYVFFVWVLYGGSLCITLLPIAAAFTYGGYDVVLQIQKIISVRENVLLYAFQVPGGVFALIIYLTQAEVRKIINKKMM